MDLNETAIYVKVVEAGSFARAAAQLEMPKSTVSAKVSALERRLGVTLIRRTTRRLFVTDAGQEYFAQSVQALRQIQHAEENLNQHQSKPHGLLRITAPIELGGVALPKVIFEFQKQHPEVQLDIVLSNETVDLISDGIDLALRAGDLKDSTLISKKLGTVYFAPFASPKYLKAHGKPGSPKELKEYCCLHFSRLGKAWPLTGPRGLQNFELPKQMLINDLYLIKSLALAGAGIALLPTFFCHGEVRDGKLIRILDDWKSNQRPVSFVYPHQEFVPKKLSAFLDVATEIIRKDFTEFAL